MEKVSQYGRSRFPAWLLNPVILFCMAAFLSGRAADPAAEQSLEYQVKAAFLLNFTKFVEWPANAPPDSPIAICILGKDPFGRALDEIVQGESVNSRKLIVERVRELPAPPACQVVFVPGSEKEVPSILKGMRPGVLTVGEGEKFVRSGGMIGFVIEGRRVRFDINQTAAANAGVKLSSRLMSVARSIEK